MCTCYSCALPPLAPIPKACNCGQLLAAEGVLQRAQPLSTVPQWAMKLPAQHSMTALHQRWFAWLSLRPLSMHTVT